MIETLEDLKSSIWTPSIQQKVFRRLVAAFSYPGRIYDIYDECGGEVLIGVLASLIDSNVGLADPTQILSVDDWSRLEAVNVAAEQANYIIDNGAASVDWQPLLGSLECPERGATVILCVKAIGQGDTFYITGPGVSGEIALNVTGLNPSWLRHRDIWNENFPMGLDMLLMDSRHIVALPRSARVKMSRDN